MKVSNSSINAIGRLITGDEALSSYRKGWMLVDLFNEYGANDSYDAVFPSRREYAEARLQNLNGTPLIGSLLCRVLDPSEFMDTDFQLETAVEWVNKPLRSDGYEVVIEKSVAKIRDVEGTLVEWSHTFEGSEEEGHRFIEEQIKKSEKKIQAEDYDGAITNARSLLEAVLIDLERQVDENPPAFDGDLPKLYKRVHKALNLDPSRPDIELPMKQMLSGLISVIHGISSISSRMGDRHVRSYKPSKHHALLVVNAARTVANFMFDTHRYQTEKPQETTSPS